MAAPTWLAATAGQQGLAGQVNQFLGAHQSTWLYQGAAVVVSQATGSGLYVSTTGTYYAQRFTTASAQTVIGQVKLQVSTVGGSPLSATAAPLAVALYADGGGFPAGAALASTSVIEQYVYAAPFWVPVPLAAGVTPSTPYWLVTSPAGAGPAYYAWQKSNQVSGASTSPDGSTWTPQAYGLMYEVLDQAPAGRLQFLYDDGGARWVALSYNAAGQVSQITETTAAQGGSTLAVSRTLTYSGGTLVGVS